MRSGLCPTNCLNARYRLWPITTKDSDFHLVPQATALIEGVRVEASLVRVQTECVVDAIPQGPADSGPSTGFVKVPIRSTVTLTVSPGLR